MPQGSKRRSPKQPATARPKTKSPKTIVAKGKAGKNAPPPTNSPKHVPAEAVRERIVVAALTLFAKSGFDGTTITQISREAGVVSPLIYYYFTDKDELWRAAADYAIGDWSQGIKTIRQELGDADPLTILKVQTRRYLYFVSRNREFGHLIINEAGTGQGRMKWLIERHIQPMHQAVRKSLEEAMAQGLIRKVNPGFLSQFVIGGVSHFMNSRLMLKTIYGIDPHDEATIDQFADFVTDMLLNGLLTAKGRSK